MGYENRSKKRKEYFSRNRKRPFKNLMIFMLGMVKESTQNALERFFPKLKEAVHMSQQAFSLARQNVKGEGLAGIPAVDSSHIALLRDAALREYYGATGHERGAVAARASLLYDIENDIIVDAKIEPLTADERSLAKGQALGKLGLELGGRKPLRPGVPVQGID